MNKRFKLGIILILLFIPFFVSFKDVKAESSYYGKVYIKIENNTFSTADGASFDGVLNEGFVELKQSSNIITAIMDFCEINNIAIETNDDNSYIKAIGQLSDFDGGMFSGWMINLNNWHLAYGGNSYSVSNSMLKNNDFIHVRYTNVKEDSSNPELINYGSDVGYYYNENDVTAEYVSFSNGALDKEFSSDIYEYNLNITENNINSIQIRAKATNYKFGPTIRLNDKYYSYFDHIEVKNDDIIYVTFNDPNHFSYLSEGETKTYKFIVHKSDKEEYSHLIQNLTIKNASIKDNFYSDVFDYEINVKNNQKISIFYESSSNYSWFINQTHLDSLENIEVKNKDIIQGIYFIKNNLTVQEPLFTYTFIVNVEQIVIRSPLIDDFNLTNGSLSKDFSNKESNYVISVKEKENNINIFATALDDFNISYYFNDKKIDKIDNLKVNDLDKIIIIVNDSNSSDYDSNYESSIYIFNINIIKEIIVIDDDYSSYIEGLFSYFLSHYSKEDLASSIYESNSSWFYLSYARYYGLDEDYSLCISSLKEHIDNAYLSPYKLDKVKATNWHRLSLVINALGCDASNFYGYDLIKDGTYDRKLDNKDGAGAQGINGWIYGLISLDSKSYEVPSSACDSREDFIIQILNKQLSDGGFALSGSSSDVDITAMAIQALSSYYNDEIIYTYDSIKIKDDSNNFISVSKKVRDVIEEALNFLSSKQTSDGDFSGFDGANLESTVQVIDALVDLGIDIYSDPRFIKDGKNAIDGMLKYFNSKDCGFYHTLNNNESNTLASTQALYTLVNLWLNQNNKRKLFDLNKDFSVEEVNKIDNLKEKIDLLDTIDGLDAYKRLINECLDDYKNLETSLRPYIYNYIKLYNCAIGVGIEIPTVTKEYNKGSSDTSLVEFDTYDKALVASLDLDKLTLKELNAVINLKYSIDNCLIFEGYDYYKERIYKAYEILNGQIDFVNTLKKDILNNLYKDSFTLDDEQMIYEINQRYESLDNEQLKYLTNNDKEALQKSLTTINNLKAHRLYLVIGISIVSVLSIVFITIIMVRKAKKKDKYLLESDE